jgi:anti-sigma factor RsiW
MPDRSNVTCRELFELLCDDTEGRLPPEEVSSIERHFAACQQCDEFVRSFQKAPQLVRDATDCGIPEDVAERLRQVIAQRRRKN